MLSRRDFVRAASCGTVALGLGARPRAAGAAAGGARYNVVLIMADDLGFELLASYGGRDYDTPQLDRMAAEGIRYTHCIATPLCGPTRATLMTGLYPFRTGWIENLSRLDGVEQLEPRTPMLGSLMRDNGYATAVVGKWQLAYLGSDPDHPRKCGFDEHCLWAWRLEARNESKRSRYFAPMLVVNGRVVEHGERTFGPDLFTDYLIDFVRRNRARPFFAYYPMALPHSPWVNPPGGGAGGGPGLSDAQRFRRMVTYLDTLVGRIRAGLAAARVAENTLLVFTSDNGTDGAFVSNHERGRIRGGKNRLNDAGTRVPLLVVPPPDLRGAPLGRSVEDLVDFTDFLPTFAEIAAGRPPDDLGTDGVSFWPSIAGTGHSPREWVFSQVRNDYFIRTRDWKLMRNGALYDLATDPGETAPFFPIGDSRQSARQRRALEQQLDRLMPSITI